MNTPFLPPMNPIYSQRVLRVPPIMTYGKRRSQQGGAMKRNKRRLVDKIAEGASMFLSGPALSFASLGLKLGGQAFKGISDNYKYYKGRQRGGGLSHRRKRRTVKTKAKRGRRRRR